MAIVAVATILSVLIERDQRREEAERADALAMRTDRARLPVAPPVPARGTQVSAVRQTDRGLVMHDQVTAEERRKRFTRVGRTARTGTSPYRSDRRESHS
jgi:hypothetical protein